MILRLPAGDFFQDKSGKNFKKKVNCGTMAT